MGGISESVHGDFPEYIIKNGWIHPNSISHYREFANELLSGKTQGYGNFIMQYHDTGCYGWKTMSYRMLYDDSGLSLIHISHFRLIKLPAVHLTYLIMF